MIVVGLEFINRIDSRRRFAIAFNNPCSYLRVPLEAGFVKKLDSRLITQQLAQGLPL